MDEQVISQNNFKDRQTGLIIFGILIIMMGCLSGLVALLTLALPLLPNLTGHELPPLRTMLPGIFLYAALAVSFIWLGIGSILCRRWARALLLILSWFWLATGFTTMISMIFMMPVLTAHQPEFEKIPPTLRTFITLCSAVFQSIIYVIVPASIAFFYKSPHVKATCEARDPVTRWTDACPLPVLSLSVFTIFSALMMAIMIPSLNGVVPLFGIYITGLPAVVIMLTMTVIYIFASRACYKLQLRGWWAAVIAYGLSTISCTITFAFSGVFRMYELMGLPASQLVTLKEMNAIQTPIMWLGLVLFTLPLLAYFVFTKRYFKTS
ncbi:MAG: hypothetical protein P4L53_12330 [Candidatus Obscuribacterales bacterium]|nr:hypothetical protein [Candidatus Obscuribacterales bacterium]